MISEFKINYVFKGKCKTYHLNGHDSWNDWAGDTNSPAVITKLFKLVCLEKQLGNDEIGPWNMKMKFLLIALISTKFEVLFQIILPASTFFLRLMRSSL